MPSPADHRALILRLFTPALAEPLLTADPGRREPLLKEQIRRRLADLPPVCGQGAWRAADDDELRVARELCDYRMPLCDGTSIPMGLPYDWYYGVADGNLGAKAPAYIVPRIAFSGALARAFQRTADPAFARALRAYILDYVSRYWLADSTTLPEPDNWLCTACRCGTWYDERFGGIYAALSHPDLLAAFSFSDLLAVFRAIDNMMTGLIPNLALGSNWRVHELSNIFTQGFAFPFLRHAREWLELSVHGLNEEFEVQFREDGSHEESCIEYGTGTWAVFARYVALAAQAPDTGLCFDAGKMQRCLEYYLSARKPFGMPATIGDAYAPRGAAALSPSSPPHPAGAPPAWDPALRQGAVSLSLAGAMPAAEFILHGAPVPHWQTRFHANSGYLFMRDGWTVDSLYAALNLGSYANCHCHLGLLGLEVAGYGREFIVDPGCSALDPRPINANFARTRAHSTVCVDGLDQQVAVPVQLSRLVTGARYDFAVGVYRGGYTQGNSYGPGCTSAGCFDNCFSGQHFRHVLFVKGSYWVVFDAVLTRPGHVAETRFQFMPNAMTALPGGGYCTGWPQGNLALLPLHWEGWEQGLYHGQDAPIEGWLPAPGGDFVPAPVYKATGATDRTPLWHGTLLFPYREATMPQVRVTPLHTGGAGFGYRIETAAYTDYLFLSNSWMPRPVELDTVCTDAPLLHLRLQEGRMRWGCTCEGSSLTVAGATVFNAPGTMLAREFEGEDGRGLRVMQPRVRRAAS